MLQKPPKEELNREGGSVARYLLQDFRTRHCLVTFSQLNQLPPVSDTLKICAAPVPLSCTSIQLPGSNVALHSALYVMPVTPGGPVNSMTYQTAIRVTQRKGAEALAAAQPGRADPYRHIAVGAGVVS